MANTGYQLGDVPAEVVSSVEEKGYFIPTSLAQRHGDSALLSNTSNAYTCFTQQQFSKNLQLFLVSYVMTTSGYYSVYVS